MFVVGDLSPISGRQEAINRLLRTLNLMAFLRGKGTRKWLGLKYLTSGGFGYPVALKYKII